MLTNASALFVSLGVIVPAYVRAIGIAAVLLIGIGICLVAYYAGPGPRNTSHAEKYSVSIEGAVASVTAHLDSGRFLKELARRTPQLTNAVRVAVQDALKGQSTTEILTLVLTTPGYRKRLPPRPTLTYATSLSQYLRNKNEALESAIEARVGEAVQESISEFYVGLTESLALREAVFDAISTDVVVRSLLKRQLGAVKLGWSRGWLGLGNDIRQGGFRPLSDMTSGYSFIGPLLIGTMAHSMALAPVKITAKKAAASALYSAATKSAAGTLKSKIAAGLLKTSIVKTLLVHGGGAAGAGVAKGGLLHMLFPPAILVVITAILMYEYQRFPAHLSREMGGHVEKLIDDIALDLHRDYLSDYFNSTTKEFVTALDAFAEFTSQRARQNGAIDVGASKGGTELQVLLSEFHQSNR